MSSTDPFASLSGAERWTAPLDALRQRQKELASRIAQVQKQAAQPLPTKTSPSPAATALHDKFTDQFNKATATVQQQQAAYKDAVAKGDWPAAHGHLTAARDTWQQLLGAGETVGAGLDYQAKQLEAQRAELDAKAKVLGYQVRDMNDAVQSMRDMMNDVRQKLGDMLEAQNEVQRQVWS
jgi:chromosome segregation ATPase